MPIVACPMSGGIEPCLKMCGQGSNIEDHLVTLEQHIEELTMATG